MSENENFNFFRKKLLTDVNSNENFITELIFNKSEKIKIDKNDHIISTIPANHFARFFDLDLRLNFKRS